MNENITVHISTHNSKMGKTPSFSTTPIVGCTNNCHVCKGKCYAVKPYRLHPSVKRAWDENFVLTTTTWGRAEVEKGVIAFCNGKRKPVSFFRWFVSGDICSPEFLLAMCRIADACRETTYLVFTKSYNLVNEFCDKFGKNAIPRNLIIVFSEWKPLVLDNPHNFPVAVFVPRGETVPARGLVCPAGLQKGMTCERCRRCWFLTSNDRVAFLEH